LKIERERERERKKKWKEEKRPRREHYISIKVCRGMCVCPVIKSTRNRAVIVWLSSVDLVSGPVPSYDDTGKRSIEINE
jgi:hypothetical protein